MNYVQRSVLVLLATVIAACSADVSGTASGQGVSAALAGDDADAGAEGEATLPFSFEIDGSAAITARVTLGSLARITVEHYPSAATLGPTHGSLPVGFAGAFSDDFCDGIRTLATKSSGTSFLATWNLQQLRRAGGVVLTLPVTPWVGPEFKAAARAGATAAGATGTAFVVSNPLELTDVRMSIDFDPDAISRIAGGLDTIVAEQQTYLAQQRTAIAARGTFSTAMSAKDVLCDLASGAARISFRIEGRAGDTDYQGHTFLTALQAD